MAVALASVVALAVVFAGPAGAEFGSMGQPTSGYVSRNGASSCGGGGGHGFAAVDIGNREGTPVYAAYGGSAYYHPSSDGGGYGNVVEIDHGGVWTRYAHLRGFAAPTPATVTIGQLIGFMGHTGGVASPPGLNNHLHFEIWRGRPDAPGSARVAIDAAFRACTRLTEYPASFIRHDVGLPAAGVTGTGTGVQLVLHTTGAVSTRGAITDEGWNDAGPGVFAEIAVAGDEQLALDAQGVVWGRSTLDAPWTSRTGAGHRAIAVGASGVQAVLDRSGAVWSRGASSGGAWVQERRAGHLDVAVGGDVLAVLDADGSVWAKDASGSTDWVRETPPGMTAIEVGSSGVQVALDGSGAVWARDSIGFGGWTQERLDGHTRIAVGAEVQMVLDATGVVWAKDAIAAGWVRESAPGVLAIAAGGSGVQMILDGDGLVWAKNTIGDGGWVPGAIGSARSIAAG